ncbi:uncharacterized protein LOC111832142 [Capsella rubella]|uniref:uncharacterized protein LOC111832142 n=1 Tax=Capsella rubella TaxID=81985 RepID=UPI000CD579C5|nr:uncharacterized protein LOC111832142 [Capsella rubella]
MSPPKQTPKAGDASLSSQFGPHPRSTIGEEDLVHVKFLCGLTSETELIAPGDDLSLEDPPPGYCSEEHGYIITFQDILHLYTIKSGRTRGTFYLSPLAGFRVFDDFPEKDEQYRSGYFFFPVNRATFGDLQELLVPHWSQKPGRTARRFENFLLSPISSGAETAWDSFTCPHIREAGARIRTRFLTISSPQSAPPKMNYREERAHKKKMELKENELKKKMVREVITLPDSDLSAESPAARPAPEEGQASGSKKRKAAEPACPLGGEEGEEVLVPGGLQVQQEAQPADRRILRGGLSRQAKAGWGAVPEGDHCRDRGKEGTPGDQTKKSAPGSREQLRDGEGAKRGAEENHDRLMPHASRAAEITANRMLVEEIEKGEIADLKEELKTLKADKKAARLEAEKHKIAHVEIATPYS